MVGKKGPFGGFCNYGIFGIWGKDPGTGKKKYKKVDAISENYKTGESITAVSARFTFVALGEDKKPVPVPKLVPETEEEIRLFNEHQLRVDKRKNN